MTYEPNLTPDPELSLLLRENLPEMEAPDWENLQARILSRAALPLAQRRAEAQRARQPDVRRSWRWLPIPTALAAALAVLLLLPRQESEQRADLPAPLAVEEALVMGWGADLGAIYGPEALDNAAILEIALEAAQ